MRRRTDAGFDVLVLRLLVRRRHACRIFGFAGVWMMAMPGSRVVAIVLSAPMLVSLVAMNYHFVSDVIAGSVLGALVAMYATHLARLKMA